MNLQKQQRVFLLILIGGAALLTFFIFQPFLIALIFAAAIAVVLQPLYQRILGMLRGQKSLAAALTTFTALLILSIPITLLGTQITKEAADLYTALTKNGAHDTVIIRANALLQEFIPEASIDLAQYARQALAWLLPNLASVFSSSARIALSAFVFFFALYYLLKDGVRLKHTIVHLSPLADTDDELVLTKLRTAVSAVIRGNLTIALIQGIVATIGFLIFGVPNATLWGSVTAIAALIPGVGTALVVVPVAIYLFLTGNIIATIGLLIWGATAVGLVDNLLGPRLLGRGTDLHPLLVFLAVLGGIALFGPLGILLGPVIVSLLIALLGIYTTHLKARS